MGWSKRWSLQPASRRSHDERCPNGSSRAKPAHDARKSACSRRTWPRPRSDMASWLVKPRLVAVPCPRTDLGLVRSGDGATRARWRERLGRGSLCSRLASTPASRASAARPTLESGRGSGNLGWCSRIALVAEVVERRSMRTVRSGSSQSISPCASRRDPQAKARRKPGRGGESHQRASSDTGGGLPVIPRRILVMRTRGREHSAVEGVLARRGTSSLTRRRPRRASDPRRWRFGRPDQCASAVGSVGSAEGARGRQRSCRKARPAVDNAAGGSLARRSLRSRLHQDRARPHTWTWEPRLPGAREDCGRGRSWRIAVKRGSTR